jgi:hypothetical protein
LGRGSYADLHEQEAQGDGAHRAPCALHRRNNNLLSWRSDLICRDPLGHADERMLSKRQCETPDMDAVEELRMLAIRQRLDGVVRADLLIHAAVRALVSGVESSSLPRLAGLTRTEEPEAQDLFRAVVSELGISLPDDAEGRWQLVRWWCREIVEGHLRPEVGGRLIWMEGWNELGYPDLLQPLVGWVSEWEDWTIDWGVEREEYERKIVAEANALLMQQGPPG